MKAKILFAALFVICGSVMAADDGKKVQPTTYNEKTTPSIWLNMDPSIAGQPQAAVRLGYAWTAFFNGDKYQLHSSVGSGVSDVWPISGIPDWPQEWTSVDAAVVIDEGTVFLIRGTQFINLQFNGETGQYHVVEQPAQLIKSGAGVFPAHWGGSIDAAVNWNKDTLMFFKGSEYLTYDINAGAITSQPADFRTWPNWPPGWDSIDAAVNPGYGAVYFFRNGEYIPWDLNNNGMVAEGYPQSMLPGAPLAKHILDRLVPKSDGSTSVPVSMTVGNRTDQPMDLVWVDFQGEEKKYGTIAPFATFEQGTGSGHLWYARQGNQVIARYRATRDKQQKFLVFAHPPGTEFITHFEPFLSDFNASVVGKSEAVIPYPNSDWLGAGFNLAFVDPAQLDLIASKAAGGEKARHDSPFRLVNSATNRSMDGKYVLPYGVSFKSAGGTRTIGQKRLITSSSDLQDEFNIGLSQGLDVGVAAFSRSGSFSQVNNRSTGRENVYTLRGIRYDGDELSMKTTWEERGLWYRQELNPEFRAAVSRLDPAGNCGAGYDQIRQNFGTHFARTVQFGGQYNTLIKLKKRAFDTFKGSRAQFEQHLKVNIPDTPVTVSSGQNFGLSTSVAKSRNEELFEIDKYASGGLGYDNEDEWLRSVKSNPLPVNMEFAPHTEILNAAFFPQDPDIYAKQEAMRSCFQAYYQQMGQRYKNLTMVNATPFFDKQIPDELKKKTPDFPYITEVRIVNEPVVCITNNVLEIAKNPGKKVTATWTLVDANLNRDQVFSENYYLCLKKDTQGKPLTRIYPISHNAASGSDDCNDNDRRLPQNVNKKWNNFGQSDFICYGTDDTEYPLYDVMIKAVAGGTANFTHRPSSAGMVLNAGNVLLYLHTQNIKQARNAGKIRSDRVDIVANLEFK